MATTSAARSLADEVCYQASELSLPELAARELAALDDAWKDFWLRPDQLPPPGAWLFWVLYGGKGSGKTQGACSWVHERARAKKEPILLVAGTASDVRSAMVEGPSGLLKTAPRDFVPKWESSVGDAGLVTWPNGARGLGFASESPERLRGKGAQTAWLDDLTNWQDGRGMAAFMQVYRNLREGDGRGVVTFNPAETELIRWILKVDNPMIVRTHSVSDVNLGSLSLRSLDQWSLIEGTEEARRDRGGELPDKSDRSPFHGIDFDKCRVGPVDPAEMLETIIAIDPSDNDLKTSDECGLIAMGKDRNGHVYLLEDRSGCVKPDVWGARAIAMADRWKASAFVAENNRGESDVRAVLNAAYWRDRAEMGQSGLGALPPIVGVCAMRGKFLRAEPVRALYLTRRIHHAGTFPELEKQMASMDPTAPKRPKQDDRADAAVHGATHLAGLNATVKNTPPRGQPFRVPGWS